MHLYFGLSIALIAAIFVGVDANKRDMNAIGWAIGTFLLCIIFLPLYLIIRKPVIGTPTVYPPQPPGVFPPPPPQQPGSRLCPSCGKYHEGDARFCPFCGAPQP